MESSDRLVPLAAVITTSELDRRPLRPADYESESHALAVLMDAMADVTGLAGADSVLQKLVDTARALCRAHSAGVSILEMQDGREVIRWRAAAGIWTKFLGESIPRDRSPCDAVLELDTPLLMSHPERYYSYLDGAPPIVEALLIPFHCEGKPVGTLWVIAHDQTREFDAEDRRLMTGLARFAAAAHQLLIKERLHDELADARLLQRMSGELIVQDDAKALYEKLLDVVLEVMKSDFASIQMYYPDGLGGMLKLLASRNFSPEAAEFWDSVRIESQGACGEALRVRRRVVMQDVERDPGVAGSEDLVFFRQTGIRAVQTTPLLSRAGKLVGMLSTHWRRPYQPTERDLLLLDVLARQAADLIERKQGEEALQEADRRKDAFIATLAHELRNPLAPVRNAIAILRMSAPAQQGMQWARDVIDRQTAHMTRLIDDLLDISRITRDKLDLRKERIDLASVVQVAIETSRPLVEEGSHELLVTLPNEPVIVDADPTRLAQVIANLLNNAAKYSEPGGRIELGLRCEGDQVVVSVRDHGIGIAEEMLPRVFDLFGRAETSAQHNRSGLGIGLTLVKRLAELHGGSVVACSEGIGTGSEFVVRLPVVTTVPMPSSVADEPLAKAPGARRVLVVDDNEDGAITLSMMIEMLGYSTFTVHDGVAGLAGADAFRPHVALLDLGMPKMSGDELARRIREQPWGKDILLIAVTGWGQAEHIQRTTEAGFDHHLVKPVDSAVLAELLASQK